jgi:hypothetical protein
MCNDIKGAVVILAFYKGRTRFLDRLIQCWTGSRFSHVELFSVWEAAEEAEDRAVMFNRGDGWMALTPYCWSSSWMDGGVRCKRIDLNPDNWELVAVPWVAADKAEDTCLSAAGKPYDWAGLVRTQVFGLTAGKNWKRRWFCSEIVADALGLGEPWQYSPGGLYQEVLAFKARRAKMGKVISSIKAANLRPVAITKGQFQ